METGGDFTLFWGIYDGNYTCLKWSYEELSA